MAEKLIEFIRRRDYVLVKELGQGACGKTVLLRDDVLSEHFVCKKYSPFSETHRQKLFTNFVREIKLLHNLYHNNVVRIFNYYLYPEQLSGYILMEYVNGQDIEDYLHQAPEKTNEIFLQTVQGFHYLEANNILHRDIRAPNIMVRDDGTVKIIDLGFGKRIQQPIDFNKSISLNWWCDLPGEFQNSIYDFKSEVYFVGKLFEKIIQEYGIDHFKYKSTLAKMCQRNPDLRIASFFDVEKEIQSDLFYEIGFTEQEKSCYRNFSRWIADRISKIEGNTKYIDDLERVQTQLENSYRSFMLEETAPDAAKIIRCFLNGQYYYQKTGFPVTVVKDFLHLLKAVTHEKARIIMANLHTKLDSIPRYSELPADDDIPF
jgi:eukaryotic-like serine/threonine-protein kinase